MKRERAGYIKLIQVALMVACYFTIKKDIIAMDEDHWITTKNRRRVLLDENGEIKAGMGGKFNGQNIENIGKSGSAAEKDCTLRGRKRLYFARQKRSNSKTLR